MAGLIVVLWVFRGAMLQATAEFLIVDDVPQPSKFLALLDGNRPRRAAELYQQGMTEFVLVFQRRKTEAHRAGLIEDDTETTVRSLELHGVPSAAIVVLGGESGVTSTYEEALTVERYLDAQRYNGPLVLVASAFRTRRARWIFARVLDASRHTVHITSAPYVSFDATNWWHHERGLVAVNNEYLKLGFYLFRYRALPSEEP